MLVPSFMLRILASFINKLRNYGTNSRHFSRLRRQLLLQLSIVYATYIYRKSTISVRVVSYMFHIKVMGGLLPAISVRPRAILP